MEVGLWSFAFPNKELWSLQDWCFLKDLILAGDAGFS
jgi:hypothetical protein